MSHPQCRRSRFLNILFCSPQIPLSFHSLTHPHTHTPYSNLSHIIPLPQFLLDKGARVNVADEVTSLTSLMAAAQCGHADIVTKLIKAGSNVNTVLKVIIGKYCSKLSNLSWVYCFAKLILFVCALVVV